MCPLKGDSIRSSDYTGGGYVPFKGGSIRSSDYTGGGYVPFKRWVESICFLEML